MKRRIKIAIFWLAGLLLLTGLMGFVSMQRSNSTCTGIEVIIKGDTSLHFIRENEIIDLIREKGSPFEGKRLSEVDLHKAELALKVHPAVANADLYFTLNGVLRAEVIQREPLLRVIDLTGDSYYIDKYGNFMPLSDEYTALVPVATGFINDPWPKYMKNVSELIENDSIRKAAIVDDLFIIAEAITADTLLSAQILQLYVRRDHDIEMIARIGPEIVLIGDQLNLSQKLRNLKLFYQQALLDSVSRSYTSINLKYHNQIICTKTP